MKTICSAGVLYLYLAGIVEDDKIITSHVHTYENAFDFYEQVKRLQREAFDIEVFCVLGTPEKVERIADVLEQQVKRNFERIVEGADVQMCSGAFDWLGRKFEQLVMEHIFRLDEVRFPRNHHVDGGAWEMYCIWAGEGAEDEGHMLIDSAVETWLQYENPLVMGKQIANETYQLTDLTGRKIIGVYPDAESGEWMVILEGGLKLKLNSEIPYMREKVGIRDVGLFTISDVDTITNNPIYAYGKWCYPTEIHEEWHKVFLYVLALQDRDWNINELQYYYEKFLRFMEENICDIIPAEPMIEKEQYYRAMLVHITELKRFLIGEDRPVISKDLWLLLNSRYVYLPYLYELLDMPAEEQGVVSDAFSREKFQDLVKDSKTIDVYQKGLKWEIAVEYFLTHVAGLQISGRRVKAIAQEIDLSVVNVSLDGALWEMGAYILVECKNWSRKVGIQVIRGLAHISELKGNKTTFLFVMNAITKGAKAEIVRAALNGKYIVCITKDELMPLEKNEDCYALLINKWKELQDSVENEFMI